MTENGPAGRRAGRAITWMAVGAIGATVLTGVAMAATGDAHTAPSDPSASTDAQRGARPGPGPGGMRGPGDLPGGPRDVLHGELVVKDGTGTKTLLTQNGTVTAASSTSLTVKSTDGFTATWKLGDATSFRAFAAKGKAATAADVAVGDQVAVVGTRTTTTTGEATLVRVRPTQAQLDQLRKNAPRWPRHDRRPSRGGSPSTTPTAPSTSSSPA